MLRFLVVSLIYLTALFSPCCLWAEMLFGRSYQQALHKYLTQSKDSVTIAMYFIIIDPEDSVNPVNSLLDDLILATRRGVKVKVVLEDSKLQENRLAYKKMRENNINVYFDTPEHLLHIKGVVIDSRYLFVGSANWSKAAIEDNYEATCFKDSVADALIFNKYIENIPIQKKDLFLPPGEGIAISADFLLSPHAGRRLLKAKADKQFDLYLWLCRLKQETGKSDLEIDYDSLAKDMGYITPQNLGRYRNTHSYFYDRLHRSLKRLRNYGLIDYRNRTVSLKGNGPLFLKIPLGYWDEDLQGLSLRARYMYLVCLYESNRSTRYPFWFRSQLDMSRLYGISEVTISQGLLELEAKGIIEIIRDRPSPPDFSNRRANVYKML